MEEVCFYPEMDSLLCVEVLGYSGRDVPTVELKYLIGMQIILFRCGEFDNNNRFLAHDVLGANTYLSLSNRQ